jgi:hypothetical protein
MDKCEGIPADGDESVPWIVCKELEEGTWCKAGRWVKLGLEGGGQS